MNETLRKCPHCDGEVLTSNSLGQCLPRPSRNGWHVRCGNCQMLFGYDDDYAGIYETEGEAVAAWNRRAEQKARVLPEWIETEWEPPADIGQRVLIYPIYGEIEVAEYIGEGMYRVFDYAVRGEEFSHWAELPDLPSNRQSEEGAQE